MRQHFTPALPFALALTLLAGMAHAQQQPPQAQQRVDIGKREFDSNCASCHGRDGKGSGPITDLLKRSPPDLTQLAKKNGGVLPMARMYEVIEGENIQAHGGRDMPVWGRDYRIRDAEYYGEIPYDADALVRARILSLIEYIHRIQAK